MSFQYMFRNNPSKLYCQAKFTTLISTLSKDLFSENFAENIVKRNRVNGTFSALRWYKSTFSLWTFLLPIYEVRSEAAT